MPRPQSAAIPQAPATGPKMNQVLDASTTALENALKVLEMLSAVTEDVPYLNGITGCIQKLIAIQRTMSDNKTRADDLLTNVGEVSRVIAQGLYDLDKGSRNNVMMRLNADLEKYQIVLSETHDILKDLMSKSFVKRLWAHGDFPGIADGIDRRINGFRDAFSVSRLIALSKGQDALDTKLQKLVDQNVRRNLEKWLQPAEVAVSQRDAANKRHSTTGKWLLDFAEFRDWIYAPNASTIISSLRGRAEPLAFFYFDTNNSGQHTVTQLFCSLVTQLSAQEPSPDQKLNALWVSYARGQHLPSDSELIAKALIPILGEFADPVYIVLDALDECSERDQLLNAIGKIVDADLPNVHLLLTSRPEVPRGSRLVERAVSISLEPESCRRWRETGVMRGKSRLKRGSLSVVLECFVSSLSSSINYVTATGGSRRSPKHYPRCQLHWIRSTTAFCTTLGIRT
ncbi:hypothetical protein DFH09DRAFT_1170518 [Mycena vulgaris]|nr:hypothetical protein DFH09DRAFT_1170518 [Mycena vulgaris]